MYMHNMLKLIINLKWVSLFTLQYTMKLMTFVICRYLFHNTTYGSPDKSICWSRIALPRASYLSSPRCIFGQICKTFQFTFWKLERSKHRIKHLKICSLQRNEYFRYKASNYHKHLRSDSKKFTWNNGVGFANTYGTKMNPCPEDRLDGWENLCPTSQNSLQERCTSVSRKIL